jgi:FkbM family methyltransferase
MPVKLNIPIFLKLNEYARATRKYRHRYGLIRGTYLWNASRRNFSLPKGTIFPMKLPEFDAPLYLRAGTSDIEVMWQLFLDEELDFPMPSNAKFIIDAGANVGFASVYLARKFPDARIVALEVDPDNYAMLKKNVSAYPNVSPIRRAMWHEAGYVKVENPRAAEWEFRVAKASWFERGAVKAISVDALLRAFKAKHVDLFKMDIEGAEKEVLSASTAWLDRTKVFAVELHDRFKEGCSDALWSALAGRKYDRRLYGEYEVITFE